MNNRLKWKKTDSISSVQSKSVFSDKCNLKQGDWELPLGLSFNTRLKMDGFLLLNKLPKQCSSLVFLDPQYRSILDELKYGNEGKTRGKNRSQLPQMTFADIESMVYKICDKLVPSGHLMLWVDKFILVSGMVHRLYRPEDFAVVDMITWNKCRMGMGYRSRRQSEFLVILQKLPKRAKGIWKTHTIPDVWGEGIDKKIHTHAKPVKLQEELIKAVTNVNDIVIDPAAGGFSVMKACQNSGRRFIGCDILG